SETFITNPMSRQTLRRTTQTGNLLYGKISPDSNERDSNAIPVQVGFRAVLLGTRQNRQNLINH
ncbi:MAG: hypothetical protein ACOCOT_08815, partial [Prevotella sp.]